MVSSRRKIHSGWGEELAVREYCKPMCKISYLVLHEHTVCKVDVKCKLVEQNSCRCAAFQGSLWIAWFESSCCWANRPRLSANSE